jgi:hypothetical protein
LGYLDWSYGACRKKNIFSYVWMNARIRFRSRSNRGGEFCWHRSNPGAIVQTGGVSKSWWHSVPSSGRSVQSRGCGRLNRGRHPDMVQNW